MFFEKMFTPKATDKKAEASTPAPEKGMSLGQMAKIAAALAMFALPQGAKAEENPNHAENIKNKTEEANLNLGKLINFVKETDTREDHTLSGVKIKEAKVSEKHQLTAATDGRYAFLSKDGGKKVFYDDNADGRLDRVVINGRNYENNNVQKADEQRNSENGLYFFDSLDNLEKNAKVIGSIKPEPITVIDLNNQDKVVTIVDYSDGSVQASAPEQSEEFIEKLQSAYANELTKIEQEREK